VAPPDDESEERKTQMKRLRQAIDIIGMLERGDLNADLSSEIQATIRRLQDLAPPQGKIKGSVSLKLAFTVEGQTVSIEAAIDSSVPKRSRSSSYYFLTADGEISVEHPQQANLLDGLREVRRDNENG
jgi:hypothetical protein